MITPTFKVDQDSNSVTIIINTPYVRVCDNKDSLKMAHITRFHSLTGSGC